MVVPPEQARVFRGDGAYIITGGLGGLGLFLAEKMAAAGCGRIVLTSRSQPNSKSAGDHRAHPRRSGADIVVECGDIAEPGTADRLVAAATATGLPLRGVLHAAAVVEDATLANITDELIERDWAPKVYGAWNLHQATAGPAAGLVLLVLLGGCAGRLAGSGCLRRGQQLAGRLHPLAPRSGPAGDRDRLGRVGRDRPRHGAGRKQRDAAIAPDEGAYAFETLLRHDRAYTGYTPITGTPWLTAFAQRSQFAEVFQSAGQSRTGTSKFRAELNALPPDEWPARLRRLVSEQVSLILRRSVDPDRPLSEYGLDSLGNLELRTRIETETGIRINSTDITTVRGLARAMLEICESAREEAIPSRVTDQGSKLDRPGNAGREGTSRCSP